MKKRMGFTLIELLVVISIIALLLSILMPSLKKAKQASRKVLCVSNLKQWGIAWSMYSSDNKSLVPTGWIGNMETSSFWNKMVNGQGVCLYPYVEQSEEIRMCPEVRGTGLEAGYDSSEYQYTNIPAPWAAWGKWSVDGGIDSPDVFKDDFGSYGVNYYAGNHPSDNRYWKRFDVPGGSRIPLFAECFWPSSAASHFDTPPEYEGQIGGGTGDLRRFTVNRHRGYTNILFMDFSTRSVALKKLWSLKWNRQFNLNNPQTRQNAQWPLWMQSLPSE